MIHETKIMAILAYMARTAYESFIRTWWCSNEL